MADQPEIQDPTTAPETPAGSNLDTQTDANADDANADDAVAAVATDEDGGDGNGNGGDDGGDDGNEPPMAHQPSVTIEDEMRSSYVDYAMSVIVGRALPDVRDGLKPVHRRVLFTQYEMKNNWNAAYKKSARIVGDVIGKYHPHGDTAVYDTLVRMAQPFSLRYMLVDGQGNFGSVDGDPAAAMRYTEVRMTRLAHELLADLDKETVDYQANYDGQDHEPTVLPTKVPNLLVNGSSGIAVGMATNIPPHNLREVTSALIALIDDPEIGLTGLMEHIEGPDFPTGGTICGRQGIIDAYETGRGKIKVRAKTHFEENDRGREVIVVDELPYQVNKARLVEYIATLVRDKKIEGISDLRDESDRTGMRMIIECRRDSVAQVVLNQLYRLTSLQTTFGIINLAIVGGRPRVLPLKDMLEHFIDHRREVVTRRCLYELRQAEARAHILEGLLTALDHLDEVIKLIRASADGAIARERLINRFGLSEKQAQAILDMRLQRLTGLERDKIKAEFDELMTQIAWLKGVLSDDIQLMDIIKEELGQVRAEYSDARRSVIIEDGADLTLEDLIADEDMVVTRSNSGYVKRTPLANYRAQRRGGRGKTGMATKETDFVADLFVASAHTELLVFTSAGRVFSLKVYELPEGSATTRGKPMVNLLPVEPDEEIRAVLPVPEFSEDAFLLCATKNGTVKKTVLTAYSKIRSTGIRAIILEDDDDLIDAKVVTDDSEAVLATRDGMSIHFPARYDETQKNGGGGPRSMGRVARGVRGIRLKRDDEVVSLAVVNRGEASEDGTYTYNSVNLLAVCANGYGKSSPPADYRFQGRGGGGVIAIKTTERNGPLVGLRVVEPGGELIIVTDGGKVIRMAVDEIRVIGRNTQGVKLIALDPGEQVVSFEHFVESEVDDVDEDTDTGTDTDTGDDGAAGDAERTDEGGAAVADLEGDGADADDSDDSGDSGDSGEFDDSDDATLDEGDNDGA